MVRLSIQGIWLKIMYIDSPSQKFDLGASLKCARHTPPSAKVVVMLLSHCHILLIFVSLYLLNK